MSKGQINKGRRNELAKLKRNKRCKILRVNPEKGHVYKNHGKPCSCSFCRNEKYKRSKSKKFTNDNMIKEETIEIELNEVENERIKIIETDEMIDFFDDITP